MSTDTFRPFWQTRRARSPRRQYRRQPKAHHERVRGIRWQPSIPLGGCRWLACGVAPWDRAASRTAPYHDQVGADEVWERYFAIGLQKPSAREQPAPSRKTHVSS